MSNFTGFVQAALQLGVSSIMVKPTRGIYGIQKPDGTLLPDILAQAVVEERHTDRMEITRHPIEQGAMISDHAFKHPAEVVLRMAWSNSPTQIAPEFLTNAALAAVSSVSSAARSLIGAYEVVSGVQSAINGAGPDDIKAVYQKLLQLQESRALFVLYTGKRVYTNMVCETLVTETDSKLENSLIVTMTCHQVILVNTQVVVVQKEVAKNAPATASPANKGVQPLKQK